MDKAYESCFSAFRKFYSLNKKASARDYKSLLESYNDALRNDICVGAVVKGGNISFFVKKTKEQFNLSLERVTAAQVINIKTSAIRGSER